MRHVPTDKKSITAKDYSETIANFTRNSLEKSVFPRDVKGARSIKDHEKQCSVAGNYLHDNFMSEGTQYRLWASSLHSEKKDID